MKPWRTVATTKHGQQTFTLKERDGEFLIQVDGKVLMNSRMHGSEIALAKVGCEVIKGDAPTVLVGGLGFGHTLRAALNVLPKGATVIVSELSAEIVEWNRTLVRDVSKDALSDPRVRVEVEDVRKTLGRATAKFNVVLLDVDNGPFAMTRPQNAALYDTGGATTCYQAIKRRGRLVVWSAGEDPKFEKTLEKAHFEVTRRSAQGHVLFVGDKD